MEIYTFVYMGGQNKNMRVRPLTEDEVLITKLKAFDDPTEADTFFRATRTNSTAAAKDGRGVEPLWL